MKESKDGIKYLLISESRQTKTEQNRTHTRVMVFEEHLKAFINGFQKAIKYLGVDGRAYKIDEIRHVYSKAYTKWTPDEDEQLKKKYGEGDSIDKLAKQFQRKPGAINSRLKKLGLFTS